MPLSGSRYRFIEVTQHSLATIKVRLPSQTSEELPGTQDESLQSTAARRSIPEQASKIPLHKDEAQRQEEFVEKEEPPRQTEAEPLGSNDDQYAVENLVGRRKKGKAIEYMVKWLGYPALDNSWVKKKDIDPALIKDYKGRLSKAK